VSCFDKYLCIRLQFYTDSASASSGEMGDWNHTLLNSAAALLPLKEAITIKLSLRYANGIFAVGLHTSDRDPISDILPPLTRTPSSGAAGSSQILLPRVFLLASHSNVSAQVIM